MNPRRINRMARHGRYLTHVEYWISIDDINIADHFKEEEFGQRRIKLERNYYRVTGLYETRILIDRNFNLVDGYISILLAQADGEKIVPVSFIDPGGIRNEGF